MRPTYLIDLVTIDFADVVGPGLCLLNHFKRDWRKHAVLPTLPAKVGPTSTLASLSLTVAAEAAIEASCAAKAIAADVLAWVEEALILTRELNW